MGIADRYPHYSTEKCEQRIRVLSSARVHPYRAFLLIRTRWVSHCYYTTQTVNYTVLILRIQSRHCSYTPRTVNILRTVLSLIGQSRLLI